MSVAAGGNMALDGHDPRVAVGTLHQEMSRLGPVRSIDPHTGQKASFEALLHYAAIQREIEKNDTHSQDVEASYYGGMFKAMFKGLKRKPSADDTVVEDRPSIEGATNLNEKEAAPAVDETTPQNEKVVDEKAPVEEPLGRHISIAPEKTKTRLTVTDLPPAHRKWSTVTVEERVAAYRALRVASWTSVFYLITTDILGPTSTPYAFSQLGYVGGCLVYVFFGLVAMYCGFQLWYLYLKLDSERFPVRTYGDIAERVFGNYARHGVNILQSIQLLFNVAVIILGNGQGLSQVAKAKVCFSALMVIWTVLGMAIGQIRSLKNFGWLANLAIWMNLFVIFATLGIVFHSAPNYTAALRQNDVQPGPVVTQAMIVLPFEQQLVGVMQAVYSYGGAMLFVEFMSEMRRPFDFWKAMILAQVFIIFIYMMFGILVYSQQGQFTINPANQGISDYGWQTATNVVSLTSALIAAGLYGNIGLKVIYANVLEALFKAPPVNTRAGRYIWIVSVIVYWSLAFIIASAVPQFSNISSLVAALCILQFSYTFPPILYLGFQVQLDALRGERKYVPGAANDTRIDSWRQMSRWRRGFRKLWYFKIFNFILFLAALTTAVLGAYSSIKGIITGFQNANAATSFGCSPPV